MSIFTVVSRYGSLRVYPGYTMYDVFLSRKFSTIPGLTSRLVGQYIECSNDAEKDVDCMTIVPGFIAAEEESSLMKEMERVWRHSKYEYSHWDKAIIGFRETEKSRWTSAGSSAVMERLISKATSSVKGKKLEPLPLIHVLDLAPDGHINPHIDSVKFCGDVIAGISLLSSCVMRLVHHQNKDRWITALLPRYSLYVMSGTVRYDYTHEIMPNSDSFFTNKHIPRERRVSVICRTKPN